MKKYLFTAILVLFSVSASFGQNELNKAMKFISSKDYAAALSIAKELIDKDSLNPAIKILLNLRQADENNKTVYEFLGNAYSRQGIIELALLNYDSYEKFDSLNIGIKLKSADLLYKSKRYTDAVNRYLQVLKLDSTNAQANKNIGSILFQAKMYADAVRFLEKDLEIDQARQTYEQLAKSFFETKNYKRMSEISREGLGKYPDDRQLQKSAAVSAFWLKNYNDALDYYSAIPDTTLGITEFIQAAKAAQMTKKDSTALIFYNKALKIDGGLKNIYMDVANLYYLFKNYDKSIEFYKKKAAADSLYEPAYRFLGFAYMQKQNFDSSRAALLKSIALDDSLVSTHFWLAQDYRSLDSLSRAQSEFSSLLKLIQGKENNFKNEAAEANGFLGQIAFEKKNYTQAINYLSKAVSIKPEILSFTVMLASAYHSNNDTNNAIKMYKRVLVLDPKNEIAKKGLRMLSAD